MKHNASVSGSQDESEGEPHMPLPPIKPAPGGHKGDTNLAASNAKGTNKKGNVQQQHEKYNTLKSEYSQQSLGNKVLKTKKKFHEDLKIDKAKIFKKAFLDAPKNGKKKKYLNA